MAWPGSAPVGPGSTSGSTSTAAATRRRRWQSEWSGSDWRRSVTFHGRIPLDDVPAAVARADIGIAPTRRDPFTDVSLSTKIFEYSAMGKPVVATRLPLVERTFPARTIETYDPGDPDHLATAVLRIVEEPLAREAAVARTLQIVRQSSWERESERYLAIVEELAAR